MDNEIRITLKDAKNTLEEVLEKYRNGELPTMSFAASVLEINYCTGKLKAMGCSVDASYEDGYGNYVDTPTPRILKDHELTGYLEFNPIKKATFLKKDVRFTTGWRLKMFEDGYRWVENPYNQKAKIDYNHATRYYVDVIKKLFWVVDLGG